MFMHFPIGLLLASVAFDVISLRVAEGSLPAAAYWMLTAGLVDGVVAALSGVIGLLAIPGRARASRLRIGHGVGNVVVLCLFIASWMLPPNENLRHRFWQQHFRSRVPLPVEPTVPPNP